MTEHSELFPPEDADAPALRDAAERAGGVIADQVRSVVEAAEAHARSICEEAEQDARRLVGDADEDANHLRLRIDAVLAPIEDLLGELRRQAGRLAEATPVEVEALTGAVEPDTDEAEPAEPPPPPADLEDVGWGPTGGDEADIEETTADDREEADAGLEAPDEQPSAAGSKAAEDVVEPERPAPGAEPSSVSCFDCEGSGSCAGCGGRGRRFGRRCRRCRGDRRCRVCGGAGVRWA